MLATYRMVAAKTVMHFANLMNFSGVIKNALSRRRPNIVLIIADDMESFSNGIPAIIMSLAFFLFRNILAISRAVLIVLPLSCRVSLVDLPILPQPMKIIIKKPVIPIRL